MVISVIIPAYTSAIHLKEVLAAVKVAALSDTEIIVVDDGSTDDTGAVARSMGIKTFRLDKNSGPAAARNHGALHAQGEILFFVDSDVVPDLDSVRILVEVFQRHRDVAAVFGSYDAHPEAKGLISQYRNLLHHFVHQNGNPGASTFWAGLGAVRRGVFEEIGGFDEERFPRPSIEDIELGYRLRQSGYRILLEKRLQGTHLKPWTLYSLIRTDILCRALPWSRLIIETKKLPDDLNLKMGQRASAALVGMACVFLGLAAVLPGFLLLSVLALAGAIVLNRKLYQFFWRRHGIGFAAACIPLHLLYYLYSGLTYVYVWLEFQLKRLATIRVGSAWNFVHHRGAEDAEKRN